MAGLSQVVTFLVFICFRPHCEQFVEDAVDDEQHCVERLSLTRVCVCLGLFN
jgi:hypothetical protein